MLYFCANYTYANEDILQMTTTGNYSKLTVFSSVFPGVNYPIVLAVITMLYNFPFVVNALMTYSSDSWTNAVSEIMSCSGMHLSYLKPHQTAIPGIRGKPLGDLCVEINSNMTNRNCCTQAKAVLQDAC